MTAEIIARPDPVCRLVDWKPYGKGALLGKATIAFASGVIICGIPVFRTNTGGLSAAGPDAPLVDSEGIQLRDADGKRQYGKVIKFQTPAARDRWSRMVLAALADAGIGGSP
jgi:hypothetical protein